MTATQPATTIVLGDPEGPKAGFGERLVAAIIDFVVLFFLGIPVAVLGPGLGMTPDLLLGATYFVVLEGGRSGQTVGKRLMRMRVVDEDTGASIGYPRALGRHIGGIISTLAMGLGFLWMLCDPRQQTWHDKMSGAVVVRSGAADSHHR